MNSRIGCALVRPAGRPLDIPYEVMRWFMGRVEETWRPLALPICRSAGAGSPRPCQAPGRGGEGGHRTLFDIAPPGEGVRSRQHQPRAMPATAPAIRHPCESIPVTGRIAPMAGPTSSTASPGQTVPGRFCPPRRPCRRSRSKASSTTSRNEGARASTCATCRPVAAGLRGRAKQRIWTAPTAPREGRGVRAVRVAGAAGRRGAARDAEAVRGS